MENTLLDLKKENLEYLSIGKKEFGEKIYELFEKPEINSEYFQEMCNSYRSPHLWKKTNKGFELRNKLEDHLKNKI